MGFIMFLLHVLARILLRDRERTSVDDLKCQLSKLVFVTRHAAGAQVETHFFYFDKALVGTTLPDSAAAIFRFLTGRGLRGSPASSLICHHVVHGFVTLANIRKFLSASLVLSHNANNLSLSSDAWTAALKSVRPEQKTTAITSSSKPPAASSTATTKPSGHHRILAAQFGGSWSMLFLGVIADDPQHCREPVCASARVSVICSALVVHRRYKFCVPCTHRTIASGRAWTCGQASPSSQSLLPRIAQKLRCCSCCVVMQSWGWCPCGRTRRVYAMVGMCSPCHA